MEGYQTISYESIFKTLPSNNLTAGPFSSISCLLERTNCISFPHYITWRNYTEYVIFLSTSTPTEPPRPPHNVHRRAVFRVVSSPTVTFCSIQINWANRNHPKTCQCAISWEAAATATVCRICHFPYRKKKEGSRHSSLSVVEWI